MSDLVVVLPGIMGSALYKNNEPIWDATAGAGFNALNTLGRSITNLKLPDGLGDDAPEDGVEPRHLIETVHVIPGLWTPIQGYTRLLAKLRANGHTEDKGNLRPLPYDWRTSIPQIVGTLTPRIDSALDRWRTSSGNPDARLVFIAHSMGGLVARSYATTRPDLVRKIITLGTPSRGSMNALKVLVDGLGPQWGWLQNLILPFARSLPGLHNLLPAYPCIDTGGDYQQFELLQNHNVNELDQTMARTGLRFLSDLAQAEATDPHMPARLHPIIGWEQDTLNTVRITNGIPQFQYTYGTLNVKGDGTVPHVGAVPKGLPLDANLLHGFPEQHSNLQANKSVLTEVVRLLNDLPPIILRGDAIPLNLRMPELRLTP